MIVDRSETKCCVFDLLDEAWFSEINGMKNVLPYVVMVTGLTAVFVWFKCKEVSSRNLVVSSPSAASPGPDLHPAEPAHVFLIDVRSPEEFRMKHKAGALNIPVDEIEALAPGLLPDKNALLLVYCRTGKRADKALELLKNMGYLKVENLHRTEM